MLRLKILLGLVLFTLLLAAQTPVQLQLQKRYGPTYAWGRGFVVKAGDYYGYADSSGKFILPFTFFKFDTLLGDMASVLHMHQGYWLIDKNATRSRFAASHEGYTVANYQKQLLYGKNEGKLFLCDKHGNHLQAEEFDTKTGLPALLKFQSGNYPSQRFGLLNHKGDTVLPPLYTSVSTGASMYAGVKNDTAFVFDYKGNLLFSLPNVMGCIVLNENFLVIAKYGQMALVSKRGKVLTPYRYTAIKITEDELPGENWIADKPGNYKPSPYFLTERGDHVGLIDTTGKEVLPLIYNRIWRLYNGWFIVNKYQRAEDELLNPQLKSVLQAGQYDIEQINDRIIRSVRGKYSSKEVVLYYDMKLRRYVLPKTSFEKETPRSVSTQVAWLYPNPTDIFNRNWIAKDTVVINQTCSRLLRSAGKWGLLSSTGDTILPLIFDSVGEYGYQRFFVGQQGKLAYLDAVGNLSMPLALDRLAEVNSKDSIAYVSKDEVYSFKNWKLRRIDLKKEPVPERYIQFQRGFYSTDGSGYLPKGVYNSAGKRIAVGEAKNHFQYSYNKTLMAVTDSSSKHMTVIDTLGRQLAPWIDIPKKLVFSETAALAINDTGSIDFLYRYADDHLLFDTIVINKQEKLNYFNNISNGKQKTYRAWNEDEHLCFEKPGYGRGISYLQWAVLIKGAEAVALADMLLAVKRKGLWGLCTLQGDELLAPGIDTIIPAGGLFYTLKRNGKYGAFDARTQTLYAPQFDSLYDVSTLHTNYLVGYLKGKGRMVNARGNVLLGPLDEEPKHWFVNYNRVTYKKNGRLYYAYPSAADAFILEEVDALPPGSSIVEDKEDGTLVLQVNGKVGLYDEEQKRWLIPAKYNHINRDEGLYICESYSPDIYSISNSQAQQLFRLKGMYYNLTSMNANQYYLHQAHSDKELVVNCRGKVIVPDTFKYIYQFQTPEFWGYRVVTHNDKEGLIDTNGRWVNRDLYAHIDDSFLYNGFHFVSEDKGWGLLNTKGKLAVSCRYHEIKEAREPKKYGRSPYDWPPFMDEGLRDSLPLFIVSKGNYPALKYGLVDENEKVLLPCEYDSLSFVYTNLDYGWYRYTAIAQEPALKGKHKRKQKTDSIPTLTIERVICAKKGKYWGLLDINNNMLAPFEYDWLGKDNYGSLSFRKNGRKGSMDLKGKEMRENEESK